MIKKSGHELVLYYNPEQSVKVMKLKGVLVRMGIRIRNVTPEQTQKTVGELVGLPEFKRAETGEDLNLREQEEAKTNCGPEIPEEMLVMHGFTGQRIDELLASLRKAGVPKVELKAVVTATNAGWTFYHLYEEIKEEHERMK